MMEAHLDARDFILDICDEMKVGDHQLFDTRMVSAAWPATGEKDNRPTSILGVTVGEFKSLALAHGGLRPDPGFTSIECLQANLGKQYVVTERQQDLQIEVHRIRDRNKEKPRQTYDLKINADDSVSLVKSTRR